MLPCRTLYDACMLVLIVAYGSCEWFKVLVVAVVVGVVVVARVEVVVVVVAAGVVVVFVVVVGVVYMDIVTKHTNELCVQMHGVKCFE